MNHVDDGSVAGLTKYLTIESLHQAIHFGSVNTMCYIPSAFKNTQNVFHAVSSRRWDRRVLVHQRFPFAVEIDQCCQVGFPGFNIRIIKVAV